MASQDGRSDDNIHHNTGLHALVRQGGHASLAGANDTDLASW